MAIGDVLNSGTFLKAFDVSDEYSRYENFEDIAQTINITFAVQQVFQRDILEKKGKSYKAKCVAT